MKHLNLIILFIFISLNIFAEEREKTIVKNIQVEGISGIQGFSYYDTNGNLDTVYAVLDTTKLNREQLIEFIQNNGLTLIELGFVDANYLHTSGNETATGQKTISTLFSDDYETATNTSKFGRSVGNGDLITLKDETKTGQILLRSFGNSEFRNGNFIIGGGGVDHGEKFQVYGSVWSNSTIQGTRFISSIATGTPPLTVNSTTEVSNLNSNYLQGKTWADVKNEISDSIQSIILSISNDSIFINGNFVVLPSSIVYENELADSMFKLRSEMLTDSTLWELVNDTLKPKSYPIRINALTAGDQQIIIGDVLAYKTTTSYNTLKLYNGSVVGTELNVLRYKTSRSGKYRYKIIFDTNYKLYRSIDNGSNYTLLATLTETVQPGSIQLVCSPDGSTVAYTDYSNGYERLYVSRDYGNYFYISDIGTSKANPLGMGISEDGQLISLGYNRTIYHYRSELSAGFTLGLSSGYLIFGNIGTQADSTVYFSVADVFSPYQGHVYKCSPNGTFTKLKDYGAISLIYTNTIVDFENGNLYVADSTHLYKSTNEGTSFTTLFTDPHVAIERFISNVSVCANEQYSYLTIFDYNKASLKSALFASTNYSVSFDSLTSETDIRFEDQLDGVTINSVDYYVDENRLRFIGEAGIAMGSSYVPTGAKDPVTLDFFLANIGSGGGSNGDILEVNTPLNSSLAGGNTSGAVSLYIEPSNSPVLTSASDNDAIIIKDQTDGITKHIILSNLANYFSSSTGLTSVAISAPTDVFNVSNSPLTSNGTINLTFDNQAQNTFFSAPSASSGQPSFRAIVDSDIPDNITASRYLLLNGAGALLNGKLTTSASTTSYASLNLPAGAVPSSPVNGDMWSTSTSLYTRINGTTYDLLSGSGSMVYPSGTGIVQVSGGSSWGTTLTRPSGDLVGTTASQSLTNKSVNGVTLSTAQGTNTFLRGDGSYATPSVGTGASSSGEILYNNSGTVDGFGSISTDEVTIGGARSLNLIAQNELDIPVSVSSFSYGYGNNYSAKTSKLSYWTTFASSIFTGYVISISGTDSCYISTSIRLNVHCMTDNTFQTITYDAYVKKLADGSESQETVKLINRTGDSSLDDIYMTGFIVGATSAQITFYGFNSSKTYKVLFDVSASVMDL